MSAQRERTRMMREPNSATIYSAALHIPVNGLDSQNAILIFILNYLLFFDHSKEVLLTGWLWMTCENLSNQILANSKSPLSFWLERRKFPPLQYLLENVGLGRRELFKNSCQFHRKCYLISASCCAALFFTEYLPEYKTRTQLVEVEMGEGKVNFNCFLLCQRICCFMEKFTLTPVVPVVTNLTSAMRYDFRVV